ncbi:aminotransferase class III-fold pyridoxal phosphate-dependent enzyme [Adhaeribacter sp. BT258]|uniref:Aminotransferase class III-fold pyridoxal phosphate-dependent enzyme n=1 Tax=Adhaeribacter terrigena TaxID=2793070 RepID=A0ABS1C0D3_9BACT|nr:aminotransferase class III-fold pyridoxal phosphate-dependent enzyme [Adhaeribacter terrigena]MBK0402622.1 aminotransferase class III-fold pyridoxal phosphate-dependent enzyme [Adhaeribacter terrigena]
MSLFNVYPLFNITPVKAAGSYVWDENGTRYLDLYGGHAVISIGHSHPHYVQKLTGQLKLIGFYSNSVQIPQQQELAHKLAALCGYPAYNLFLVNSGAEAIENALKVASFHTGRKKVISFSQSFHGRTSAAVAFTDDPSIQAPVNSGHDVLFMPFNDEEALQEIRDPEKICAVIIEGIQGVGGVNIPSESFLKKLRAYCNQHHIVLILDEIQSGYGRSGKFFAHQHAGIEADIITMAKGMGNGFPVGGILLHPKFEAKYGMLGTTFGGNYLACAAALAVLEVMEQENLVENAAQTGMYLMAELSKIEGIKEVRGLGLMIGIEMPFPVAGLRKELLEEYRIFTGSASNKNTLRILPALNLKKEEADLFLEAFSNVLAKTLV